MTVNETSGAWPLSVRHSSLNSIMAVAATLLIAMAIYKFVGVLKFGAWIMRELFLFWTIALSTSQHKLKKSLRLHPYLCETSYLDEIGVNELFHFYKEDFADLGHKYSVCDLHKLLTTQYTHVLMCRDRVDGTLRGAVLLGMEHKGDYTLLITGLATFKNYYRGSPFIKMILIALIMGELIKHPLTPVYLIAKVHSYKAYLFAVSARECYPVYNRETPEHIKKIFADFAAGVVDSKAGRAKYNPDTFVIENEDSCLAENLTVLSKQDLQNPHIKFFVERNPGWRKGHCLVIGARITWMELLRQTKGAIVRIFGHKKQKKIPVKIGSASSDTSTTTTGSTSVASNNLRRKRSARPKLLKRYTFQEMSANTYAVNNLEYDITGEVVLNPTAKAMFAFQTEADITSSGPTDFNIDLASLI